LTAAWRRPMCRLSRRPTRHAIRPTSLSSNWKWLGQPRSRAGKNGLWNFETTPSRRIC